jgi:stress-induced morphogen
MKENIFRITICVLLCISIITIACLSIYISMFQPKEMAEYVSIENVSNIHVSTRVPETNQKFEFNLTNDEMQNLIKLMQSSKVKRMLRKEYIDAVGFSLTFTYSDGSTIDVSYLKNIKIGNNWYKIYGYVFEYIYETGSYKLAYETAKV